MKTKELYDKYMITAMVAGFEPIEIRSRADKRAHLVAGRPQGRDDVPPEEAIGAGDESPHAFGSPSSNSPTSRFTAAICRGEIGGSHPAPTAP